MKLTVVIFVAAVILFSNSLRAANVIGYFANWGIYGSNPYTAEKVPYTKLTHIQYAFFNPEANGDISSFDYDADEQILLGKKIWTPVEHYDSTTSLVYLAHKNNAKILASIGGWTGSSGFPALAGSAVSRSKFCSNVRGLINKYDFDGFDIDWEFPCFADHNGTPDDAMNFVLLLSELRDTINTISGEKKLITLAIPGGSYHGKNFLVEQFQANVDYISIMTYDYTGKWGSLAWHSSPLYDYGSSDNWSLDRAMKYYTERGVPVSKLNIGMAFYGKTLSGCEGPNKPFTGAGEESGSLDYSVISEKIKNGVYTRYWDEGAMVPYCLSSNNEYCSYDDTTSIRLKSEYCVNNGYAGAIIWELKAGTINDGTQPLLDAASRVLLANVPVIKSNKAPLNHQGITHVKILHSAVNFTLSKPSAISVSVFNVSGKLLLKVNKIYSSGEHKISLNNLNNTGSSMYLVKLSSAGNSANAIFCYTR